jgi:hypothetical protein
LFVFRASSCNWQGVVSIVVMAAHAVCKKADVSIWRHYEAHSLCGLLELRITRSPHEVNFCQHHVRSRRRTGPLVRALYGLRDDRGATIARVAATDYHDRMLLIGTLPVGPQQPTELEVQRVPEAPRDDEMAA